MSLPKLEKPFRMTIPTGWEAADETLPRDGPFEYTKYEVLTPYMLRSRFGCRKGMEFPVSYQTKG